MPQFAVPADGILKEVLIADLSYYLGSDARLLDTMNKNNKQYFCVQASKRPDSEMLESLRSDTRRWRSSRDYDDGKAYTRSRTHSDRTRRPSNTSEHQPRQDQRRPSQSDYVRSSDASRPIRMSGNPSRHGTIDEVAVDDDRDSAYGSMPSHPGSPQNRYAAMSYNNSSSGRHGRRDSYSANVESQRRPVGRPQSNDSDSSDDGLRGIYGFKNRHRPESYDQGSRRRN